MEVLLEGSIHGVVAALRHRVLLGAEAATTLTNGLKSLVAHTVWGRISTGSGVRFLDSCSRGLDASVSSWTKRTNLGLVAHRRAFLSFVSRC